MKLLIKNKEEWDALWKHHPHLGGLRPRAIPEDNFPLVMVFELRTDHLYEGTVGCQFVYKEDFE